MFKQIQLQYEIFSILIKLYTSEAIVKQVLISDPLWDQLALGKNNTLGCLIVSLIGTYLKTKSPNKKEGDLNN